MVKDFFLPPSGKLFVIGYKFFQRWVIREANNVPFAKNYARKVISGEIPFEDDLLIASHKDLDGIEVHNSAGEIIFCTGEPYGAFLMR